LLYKQFLMKKIKLLVLAFLFLNQVIVHAQIGSIDYSFGNNGVVFSTLGTGYNVGKGIVQQADGKLVVGCQNGNYVKLVRYKQNGIIDSTYGINGVFNSQPFTGNLGCGIIGLQPDGKVVVGATTGVINAYRFAVIRVDTSGNYDYSFGVNGFCLVDFNVGTTGDDIPSSILIKDNSTFYLAGECSNGTNKDFAIAKFNNGVLNNSFGTNGKLTYDFSNGNDYATGITWDATGNILVGGKAHNGSNYDFAIIAIDTNGNLLNSFGVGGKRVYNFLNEDNYCEAIATQKNGKIILTGSSGISQDVLTIRLNTNGTLDGTFGTSGAKFTNNNGTDVITSIAIQDDDNIVVGGYTGNSINYELMLIRYLPNGTLDPSFDFDGIATTAVAGSGISVYSDEMLIQNDGKVVVAGYKTLNSSYDIAIARFNNAYAYFNVYPDTIPLHWVVTNEAKGSDPMSYLWSWGDGTTSTGATPSHIYSAPGFYNICLTITDANNCVSTFCDSSTYINRSQTNNSMIYVSVIQGPYTPVSVGVSEIANDNSIELYPNPVSDMLTIKNVSATDLQVYDLLGRNIDVADAINYSESELRLDVSSLSPGIYFLRNKHKLIRFIKQN